MPEKFEVMLSTLRNMPRRPPLADLYAFAPQKATKSPASDENTDTQRLLTSAVR